MSALHNTLSSLQHSADFALAFRIRQPQPAQPKALLVLLHGVGGSESNLVDLSAEAGPDTLVLLPRGPLTLGPGQFAWFRVAFTSSGPRIDAQEAEQSRLILIRFVAQVKAAYGVLSGRILSELEPLLAVPARVTALQAFIGLGEFDSKLPVMWAQRSEALLSQLGVAHSSLRYPIDHGISAEMRDDFLHWLADVVNVE